MLADTGIVALETLVVLEATSSYWVTLALILHDRGFVVSVVNPLMSIIAMPCCNGRCRSRQSRSN